MARSHLFIGKLGGQWELPIAQWDVTVYLLFSLGPVSLLFIQVFIVQLKQKGKPYRGHSFRGD